MRRIETYDWWPELVRRKDELSLRELAERFDVTPGAISAAFRRTGLSRKAAPPGPRIRRKASGGDELLPPEPGEGEEGTTARPGSKDTRILPYLKMLGQVPDSDVAKKAGVSVRTIASFRARNNVGGYKGPRKRGADRAPRKSRIDAFAHLVGQHPDRIVAEKAGVSLNAVRNWRMRHGVPASGRVASEPLGAGVPGAVATSHAGTSAVPSTATYGGYSGMAASTARAHPGLPIGGMPPGATGGAWKVVAGEGRDGHVRVVVAASLADAASRVEQAGLGKILALEWIGEVV
jgi:hypothetical protein